MALYKYEGPVYRNGRPAGEVTEYTHANSKKQAANILIFRLGKGSDILTPYLTLVEPDQDDLRADIEEYDRNNMNNNRFCPHCGNHLFDNGECPLCNNTDYSIMDDIKLMKDIDNGNYEEI